MVLRDAGLTDKLDELLTGAATDLGQKAVNTVTDPKRIRDHVVLVTPELVGSHLETTCARFEGFANEIWAKTHLQEAARVFPNTLRCIARQLRILSASVTMPIEVAAAACRTVFELNVRTRFMTADRSRIKDFWVERVFEEISIIDAFKRLSDSEVAEERLRILNDRIEELRRFSSKWQLAKPRVESTFKMAELVGMDDEYKALYGFYSKYTHGTAWLVNAKDDERDGEGYRRIFLVQTQIYAADAYARIEGFVRENEV